MFFKRKIAARSWNFFCNSFTLVVDTLWLKSSVIVAFRSGSDPDPTLVEFFVSYIEIKVLDRIRIQRIWDPRTSAK